MRFNVSIDQKAVRDTLKKLSDLGDKGKKAISEVTKLAADEIRTEALINVSQNDIGYEMSKLIGDIVVEPKEKGLLKYYVDVKGESGGGQKAVDMAAYIEFGTGAFIQIAPEWKDLAILFYKNGKGTIKATPYLYPAYTKVTALYKSDLQEALDDLIKKI